MKNHICKVLIGLAFIMSCTKVNIEPENSNALEQRGNDNHKIWNLAQVDRQYTYSLSDGSEGYGAEQKKYEYSCVRPFGRAVKYSDHFVEDGEVLWDNSSTMSYNDNFMISVEQANEYGDEVVRTFLYNSDHQWTGITTEINGEVIEDKIEIGPGGQVKSYSNNGVRFEYIWKANNTSMMKIYLQNTATLRSVQNSLAFNYLGINENSRRKTKELILQRFKELQVTRRSPSFRGKLSDEWVLYGIEEHTVDPKVIEPFSSPAKGYPGTTSDGGYFALSKNWTVKYRAYLVNDDGTVRAEYFTFIYDSYSVKDNLPVDAHFTYFEAGYTEDEEGNSIDYQEQGTEHFGYISGCNQGK